MKRDLLLIYIILVGVILRFYGFPHIPFMYDEVSAWARTGFTSFHELIEKGVQGDGHPAGIQVFLNYWRMVAGDSEAAFKLPFLIMGLLSIWQVFRIGRRWFNETVGYICATFIAVIQYTVMYSQIARPYTSGLFFSLMMVGCWSNYFFSRDAGKQEQKSIDDLPIRSINKEEIFFRNRLTVQLLGYIIFSTLCCYNHYFSLLFAVIVGFSGLFFLDKRNWKGYIISGIVIILLFLPHLQITLYQLGIGGVGGWLGKPTRQFFSNYLNYIFQFSLWLKSLVVLLLLASLVLRNKNIASGNKFRLLAITWFLTPMLIGYFYSVHRNAVLQYSVLIFSFPFFLLFIFSLFRNLSPLANFVIISAIMIVGIYGLIFERRHYEIFFRQPIEQLVVNSINTKERLADRTCTILLNQPKKYIGYYLRKFNSDLQIDYWPEKNFSSYIDFRKYVSSLSTNFFIVGNISGDYLMLIKQYYPYLIESDKGFTYNYRCFAKNPDGHKSINESLFSDSLNLMKPGSRWSIPNRSYVNDASQHLAYRMDSLQEWGPGFTAPVLDLVASRYDVLNVALHVQNVNPDNKASLVMSLDKEDKPFFWQEKPLTYFIDSTENSGTVVFSLSLRDVDFEGNPELKVYLWNKNKDEFLIDRFHVDFEAGNPLIYGLIEKVPKSSIGIQ
ncbi:MAG: glycosyltransferase family 39 protein [Chitinophagales bacterium]|nr:glycosyltransferase family 39 protein [Chitinophagales bacterium]